MPSLFSTASFAFALAASVVKGHMEMSFPAPLRSKYNPHATTVDSDMVSPLASSGSNYPCKGYLSDLDTPSGKSVATFAPGQKSNITIVGGAAHNGGSCQALLSYDKGKSFKVIQSWIGECPVTGEANFDFTVPGDAPAGDAVFAWTWNNKVGNPELYMNCAAVTIGGAPKNRVRGMQPRAAVAFDQRPAPFLSNIGNGCKTENMVVDYPNPGPDVIRKGDATKPTCDGGAGQGSGGGGGGAAPPVTSTAKPEAPAITPTAANPATPPAATTSASPKPSDAPSGTAPSGTAPSGTAPGGVFVTATPTPAAGGATNGTTTASPTGGQPAATPTGAAAPVTGQKTGACTDEGVYNCLNGDSFQRCASGQWSTVITMTKGTSCTPGQSQTLFAGSRKVRRSGARKFNSPWVLI